MANIIWKNKNSDSIQGLLICELPPISKPKMRTSKTTIDGRDGDILNDLGYESYTKSISVGLTRNYDVDEIIKYFSGEGKLVLSNEPDKYYISKIIDKVDYDKLIRFKKATIKFYTQPFKYKYNEAEIIRSITSETKIKVNNIGLENSKPIIELEGSGDVQILLNGSNIFKYTFPANETKVTIDSEKEEAYLNSEYRNRNMLGEFPLLNPGENEISWVGNLTKIKIQPRSRWL